MKTNICPYLPPGGRRYATGSGAETRRSTLGPARAGSRPDQDKKKKMAKISRINRLSFGLLLLVLLSGLLGMSPISGESVLEAAGGADLFAGENGSEVAKGTAEIVAAGIWIAPDGGKNVSDGVEEILPYLAGPSRILRIMVQEEEVSELGYIGTSDGVLVLWPDVTETLKLKIGRAHV